MPKSDTWPGGAGMETMNRMDSAGSCDSVVSGNSGRSDDSLDYLSAEERACLMFLEETIESLDTEEDSGLSNDEPDRLPNVGNLATELADLSASTSKSKSNDSQKPASKEQIKTNAPSCPGPQQGCLHPTPFVVERKSVGFVLWTKTVPASTSQFTLKHDKSEAQKHKEKPTAPPVPLEVNVVPAPSKPKEHLFRSADGPLARGPLSYDALVHLRRIASTKKTPLCPTVDHTIELDKCHPATVEVQNSGHLHKFDKFHLGVSKSKKEPPAVAPKPKRFPTNIPGISQTKGKEASHFSNSATDPQAVRLQALQKLGLVKDQESEDGAVAPPPPSTSHSFLNPTPKRFPRDPFICHPSRSPSFYSPQAPSGPKTKVLQTSASFHHHSRNGQQLTSASHHPGLERCTSLDNHASSGNESKPQQNLFTKPVNAATDKPAPENPSNLVGYRVMVVPVMGADRKEALRKLGLLKQ